MIQLVQDINLSKNFKISEFICKEGKNEVLFNMELINKLQQMRDIVKEPIYIASGYRSVNYNKACGGAAGSQHLYGKAADIKCKNASPFDLLQIAEQLNFGGIGIYNTWLHVDVRSGHSRWYKKEHNFSDEVFNFIKKLNYKPY
jgi:uncharacterized protein YcbK (DUF882 family)